MKVGTICKLKVDCLSNKAGTLGVVFNDYSDGFQVIFENGLYDEFSTTSIIGGLGVIEADYFLEEVGFEESLAAYPFKNVMQVEADYRSGLFYIAWSEKWQGEYKPFGKELDEPQICESLRKLSKQTGPSLKVSLPAIKPSEMMNDKKAELVDFEEVPLAELLYFIADMI